eukprot:TRINITY_DN5588_c0_g1_i1.p1 TRINITY_DN5588_c0_g1~~TRINITY_DN5588_c0_g1_i1.p1  ORF type:complete len:297 (+),score=-10.22 TRINITY_DN5588_c0_g1_i1:29-892(+)
MNAIEPPPSNSFKCRSIALQQSASLIAVALNLLASATLVASTSLSAPTSGRYRDVSRSTSQQRNIILPPEPHIASPGSVLARRARSNPSEGKRRAGAVADGGDARAVFARRARRLVAGNTWGVLSTVSRHLRGAPFGNVVSFSDGPPGNCTGTPFLYLSPFDPSAADVAACPSASLAVSALPLGECADVDPESPLCTKLTLTGQLVPVSDPGELAFGKDALFTRHPEMRTWPPDHHFMVLKLLVTDLFMLDGFAGARPVSVEDYFAAAPENAMNYLAAAPGERVAGL